MTIGALLHDPDVLVLDEPDSPVPVDGHNVVHLGDEGPGSYTTASRDRTWSRLPFPLCFTLTMIAVGTRLGV